MRLSDSNGEQRERKIVNYTLVFEVAKQALSCELIFLH